LTMLAAGAFVAWRGSSVLDPAPPLAGPVVSDPEPTPIAPPTPSAEATATPQPAATLTVPVARPSAQAAETAAPIVAPPPLDAGAAGEGAATIPPSEAAGSRIRMTLEHPFENGRLIVWIDGVLVHETKLQASASKRIVAFKVREGRAETLLDVEPGPHEVRVEVTWEQGRSAGTKVVDVAPNSTGLLEVRVGRMSKDVSLAWSRLAKE
jgi:hypothetical protein